MPRNHQARSQMKRLRIFGGAEHDHEAQEPVQVNL
jgi:ribosomal protein L13